MGMSIGGNGKGGITGVVSGFVDALKNQPGMLLVIALNVVMIWFMYTLVDDFGERSRLILERCLPGVHP
jgi:hypothetical protein